MNFYVDGKYSAFEELMHYYHISFNVYYVLVLMVLINCIRAIVYYYSLKKQRTANFSSGYIDLLLSMLAGMGLATGLFFSGIFADMSSKYFKIWGHRIIILCVVALVIFIIQVIFTQKSETLKNRRR